MQTDVVILTGGREGHQELLEGTGLKHKAMLPVGGKPMVLSVFEAASVAFFKPKMYISTNDPSIAALKTPVPFQVIPSESSAVASFVKSAERVPGDGWLLFISADHPLLTTEMIEYFVRQAWATKKDIVGAVVGRKVVRASYPASRRTYLPVKGDGFSGANMFILNRKTFQGYSAFFDTWDRNRKKPWKSILTLKPLTIVMGLLRLLDIHELVSHADPLVGCSCGLIEMPWAECCMDVDKVSDRILAEEILARRRQGEADASGPASVQVAMVTP